MTRQNTKYSNETSFEWDETEDPYYTTVDNYICDNDNIEYNSQGIYLQIVKFKNSATHKVYMSSLESNGKGSRRDIQRGILNLRMEGFIFRQLNRESGKLKGYTYKIRRKPLKLSDMDMLEIFNESKINREYILKIYGQELYDYLENLNKINESTENSNCVIGEKVEVESADCSICVSTKSVSTRRAAKKENTLKNKIGKKENKTTTTSSGSAIRDSLYQMYVDNFDKSPYTKTVDSMMSWCNLIDIDTLGYALHEASSNGKDFKYANGILKKLYSMGIRKFDEIQ